MFLYIENVSIIDYRKVYYCYLMMIITIKLIICQEMIARKILNVPFSGDGQLTPGY